MILVTGATGFLGKRVCKKLDTQGFEYVRTSLSLGLDLRDEQKTIDFFCTLKPDYVINCAAFLGGVQFGYDHAGEMFYDNIKMELSLLEACRAAAVKRLVNPIGNCSYPGVADIYRENEFWNGPLHESVLAYGMAKKAFCVGSWAYHRQYGLDVINLVFPNMYGPEDHFDPVRSHAVGGMIMRFVQAFEENRPEVVVWGTGKPVREWLYVDDGAEALLRALEIDYYPDIVNVGTNCGISIRDTALLIKKLTGYKGGLVFDTSKIDGAPNKVMDAGRCYQVLGWLPEMPFEEGMQRAIEWYIENREAVQI